MRIAAANQNFATVAGHEGMAHRIIAFVSEAGWPPREVTRIDLPKARTIHVEPDDKAEMRRAIALAQPAA